MFKPFFRRANNAPTRATRRRQCARVLQYENLENRQLMAGDLGGNSFAQATNLGTNLDHVVSDYVGTSDTNDYFKFTISQRSTVDLDLSRLTADIDLKLYNANQSLLASSTNGSNRSESISRTLDPGTYFAQVYPYRSASSNYTLELDIEAIAVVRPDHAGNSLSAARNLGTLSGVSYFDDFVSTSGDRDDYYRFYLPQTSNFLLAMSGLSSDADVELLNSFGSRITSSTNWGSGNEAINQQLSAGTYYVRVFAYQGETTYNLRLQADAVATVTDWGSDSQVVAARNQLRALSSWGASMYRQLDIVPLSNSSTNRSADNYARMIEQFNVQDTSQSTNISNRYTRGGYNNWDTRCNIFAGDVMRAMNAPLPTKSSVDRMFRNANSLNNWLNSQEGRNAGWTKIDVSTGTGLQQLLSHVRAGGPALASLNASVNTVSGHIAVIRPDQPTSVNNLATLRIAQAGASNFANNTVSYGFGSTNGVEVFIHA